MLNHLQSTARRLLRRVKVAMNVPPPIRRYMAFCRRTWPVDYPRAEDSVVLVGLFHWNASVHCYAHVTNYLARKTGSVIEWFYLHGRRNYLYENIFGAFGARRAFTADDLQIDEAATLQQADEIFAGLRSKWDVINIAIEGVEMGDLIYDTYLRSSHRATVDIADRMLHGIILQAVRFTKAANDYFRHKKVKAAIVDHTVYLQSGIVARLACYLGVPLYQVHYGPDFFVVRVENDREISDVPMRLPFSRYRQLFGALSPEEQTRALARGREALEGRLAGKVDGVLFNTTAYGSEVQAPALRSGAKPRILVLLHEFTDTVHCYRRMLFPDFYEWTHFLLRIAEETDFDWYVKPHPSVLVLDEIGRPEQAETNRRINAELKEKYPRVTFLDPGISNRQLIAEGITAMFTVHGTAGHEFAYLGVPVVNAGDNPHAAYRFNIHPQTIAEYEQCIRNAATLPIEIRREEIEEYCFMNYFYFSAHQKADANPIPASYFESEYYRKDYLGNQPEAFDYFAEPLPAAETEALQRYFDRVLTAPGQSAPAAAQSGH